MLAAEIAEIAVTESTRVQMGADNDNSGLSSVNRSNITASLFVGDASDARSAW